MSRINWDIDILGELHEEDLHLIFFQILAAIRGNLR